MLVGACYLGEARYVGQGLLVVWTGPDVYVWYVVFLGAY